jgi:hypothetical protein
MSAADLLPTSELVRVMTDRCVDRSCEGGDTDAAQADSSEQCRDYYGLFRVDDWCDMCLFNESIKRLAEADAARQQAEQENEQLRSWRTDVTVALGRPGGSFYEDVPEHIRHWRRTVSQIIGENVEQIDETLVCRVCEDDTENDLHAPECPILKLTHLLGTAPTEPSQAEAEVSDLRAQIARQAEALDLVLTEPHGCRFCDSGSSETQQRPITRHVDLRPRERFVSEVQDDE